MYKPKDRLEPDAAAYYSEVDPSILGFERSCQFSIAISLKRIADRFEGVSAPPYGELAGYVRTPGSSR